MLTDQHFVLDDLISLVKEKLVIPLAVRSSGRFEDLGDASFAGMYDTFLNVNDLNSLGEKVHLCFESTYSERVLNYITEKRIFTTLDNLNTSMSVLVQEMIPAKISGVLFTLDPQTGREDEFYVDYCDGLGDQLVSGLVSPSRCRIDISQRKILRLQEISGSVRLRDEKLLELMELGQRIQRFYGCPQDIEWCIDQEDKIWILQARPITSFNWRTDVPELTNADFKDGGISARVCTPLMYSVYERALQKSMGEYFCKIGLVSHPDRYQWIYSFYGRAYWNAQAVKECLLTVPDFDEEKFDRDLGILKDYSQNPPRKSFINPASLLKALSVLSRIGFEYQDCLKMVVDFRPWFTAQDDALKSRVHRAKELSRDDFNQLLAQVLDYQFRVESSYFRVIYNNSNIQSEIKRKIKDNDLILSLISDLPLVAHSAIASGLGNLSELIRVHGVESAQVKQGLAEFIREHYHHGECELDLTVARWGEKPEQVLQMAINFQGQWHKNISRFHDLWANYVSEKPLWWKWFVENRLTRKITLARNFLMLREELRTYSTRAYYLLRLMLLELNRREGLTPNKIFQYQVTELLDIHAVSPDTLEFREMMYESYRNFTPPNEFGGSNPMLRAANQNAGLRGIGCSKGIVRGRVRVILEVSESHQLEAGEILVTRFTDPGWTPVMVRAKAIITEVGGILSHAAVISREFGIPAILNVTEVTRMLKTGDYVEVDGSSGTIELLEHES
ncbi:MAG: hypothetical protein LW878_02305 [Proteobacteria bacterium]|nr:hypothetical protein [Pseudomonadota bacterium]